MALFLLYSNGSSSSIRFYILALIVLVLICFSSYCSSSSLVLSMIDDIDTDDDEINYHLPFQSSSIHYIEIPDPEILPSKNRFIQLLLKSNVDQPRYRYEEHQNNKRHTSQAFHAMRG